MRGLKAAKMYHDENTGMPYFPFKIKDDAKDKSARVRVLVKADYEYGDNDEILNPDEKVIQSIFMHNQFKVINSTRCTSNEVEPDKENCPLCRVGAPRSLRTYLPVRVRGDENETRVQIIEYGRNSLDEVQNFIEEFAPDGDLTQIDAKIKRSGKNKDTKYRWMAVPGTERPLDDDELALEIPDMESLIPIKDELTLEKLAVDWQRWKDAKDSKEAGGDDGDGDGDGDGDDDDADAPVRSRNGRKTPF